MNILLTGAGGLLGKELLPRLSAGGMKVWALDILPPKDKLPGIEYIQGDLFDETYVKNILGGVKPNYLINLAWKVSGDYADSPLNFKFLQAGMNLLKAFCANGGKRAVYFGSMFEYAASEKPLAESSPLHATNAYEECKTRLYRQALDYSKANGIELLWIRPFQIFGKDEVLPRLTAQIINALKGGIVLNLRHSRLKRDFVFAPDCAAATVKALFSKAEGALNICTGEAVSLADYAKLFFKLAGKEDLLSLSDEPSTQPSLYLGDNYKLLNEVGFNSFTPLPDAVKIILQSNNIPYTDN